MKAIDVYYHDDFDGISSAGIFTRFMETEMGVRTVRCHPINYDRLSAFLGKRFSEPIAVLDFPFHNDAAWWFDHHTTSFRDQEMEHRYHEHLDTMLWDKTAFSCPQLLFVFLEENYPRFSANHEDAYARVVAASNMIDSARYPSVDSIYNYDDPFIVTNKVLELDNDLVFREKYIRALADFSLPRFISSAFFGKKRSNVLANYRFMLDRVSELIDFRDGIVMIDYLGSGTSPDRYIQYKLYPEALFSVILSEKQGLFHLGVGFNPWLGDCPFDIGTLMKTFGGGGRKNVGAALFDHKTSAYEALSTLPDEINRRVGEDDHSIAALERW